MGADDNAKTSNRLHHHLQGVDISGGILPQVLEPLMSIGITTLARMKLEASTDLVLNAILYVNLIDRLSGLEDTPENLRITSSAKIHCQDGKGTAFLYRGMPPPIVLSNQAAGDGIEFKFRLTDTKMFQGEWELTPECRSAIYCLLAQAVEGKTIWVFYTQEGLIIIREFQS